VRAGLSALVGQQLVLMGAFFVISVYLWVVLGLDAFQTGKHLLPLSVAMFVFALLGQRIAARRSPRTSRSSSAALARTGAEMSAALENQGERRDARVTTRASLASRSPKPAAASSRPGTTIGCGAAHRDHRPRDAPGRASR
jgi:hypothetical protein